MRIAVALGWLGGIAALIGCDDRIPVGPGSEGPASVLVRALCEFAVRCQQEVDVASCVASTTVAASLDASITAGRVRYDAAVDGSCRGFLRSAPCTIGSTRAIPQICGNVFVGAVGVGGTCTGSIDCVRPGRCSTEGDENAACTPGRCFLPDLIPGCTADSDCGSGRYCRLDYTDPTGRAICTPKVAVGQPCPQQSACPADTVCGPLNGVDQSRCQPLAADGESCKDTQCASLLSECDLQDRICKPLHELGEPCAPVGCRGTLRCVDGVCRARAMPGEPCTPSFGQDPCARGRCANGICQEPAATCTPPPP